MSSAAIRQVQRPGLAVEDSPPPVEHIFGVRDFSAYRNADKDYSSRLGDKELYRRYYREGFENGYEDGVRGY